MDFLPAVPRDVPRQLYKAELTLTVGSTSRRGSTASSDGKGRRKSFGGLGASGNGKQPETQTEGVWYWSCQVGVTDQTLIILPQSKTSSPLTRSPKMAKKPLSNRNSADYSAHAHAHPQTQTMSTSPDTGGKGFMSGVRRISTSWASGKNAANTGPASTQPHQQASHNDPLGDSTMGQGQGRDTSRAAGAGLQDDTEVDRETGWPGVVDGNALQAIVVPLSSVGKLYMDASSKSGSSIDVGVRSAVNGKAGTLTFNFSNDWIGGKGEAEVLYNKIENGMEKTKPMFNSDMFKIGSSRTHGADKQYNDSWRADVRGRW